MIPTPQVPAIRSSDSSLIAQCPFLYFLKRRLGLVPAWEDSEALTMGTWFHTAFRLFFEDATTTLDQTHPLWAEREAEIRKNCSEAGMGDTAIQTCIDTELRHMRTAAAWVPAALNFRHPGSEWLKNGLHSSLRSSTWKILCWEQKFQFDYKGHPVVIQPDALLLNTTTKEVWCLDLKTCQNSPSQRLQICPYEFQTRLYSYLLRCLFGAFKFEGEPSGMPGVDISGLKFGGFMHVAIQKPSIRLSKEDAPFVLACESKRTKLAGRAFPKGGRWSVVITNTETGEVVVNETASHEIAASEALEHHTSVKARSVADGEPSYERYSERCARWYRAQEEFTHLAPQWHAEPPVNLSFTKFDWEKDARLKCEFEDEMTKILDCAACAPKPELFPRRADGMTNYYGNLTPYAKFYGAPEEEWPTIIKDNCLIVSHRDGVLV